MRYISILCILFIHLVKSFSAEAGTPLPINNVSTQKTASLSAADQLRNESGEVVRSIQFACYTFSARDHRITDGTITVNHLSSHIAAALQKRLYVFSSAQGQPLIRLLLFPNHYFW